MILMIKDREVEVEVDAAGAACDSYFCSGYYIDNNQELTDRELEYLTEAYQDALAEYCLERHGYWRE